ncbi:hypothetical protein JOC28_000651 [Streptococcus loxodontisalivarius]|uniref:Uncharacterized protein n=1 Tax=Streptococcus loxodontisalivarius TaxID=1349415 RepID=A0ABS2PQN4_9STRE|nr:hypothetical protein [Streptococcus loxodontisalivarius]
MKKLGIGFLSLFGIFALLVSLLTFKTGSVMKKGKVKK